ncbi:iron ABC transporter permease [bacterium]|nr:iron ABC transporter permease [bacterium]
MTDLSHEKHPAKLFLWTWLLIAAALVTSFFLGRYPEPFVTVPTDLRSDPLLMSILVNLRLPRILSALLLGMVLSASAMVFQIIFRNPLVDSGFLGVSSGAAFGASFAIVTLGGAALAVQGCAAFFACLGLVSSYVLARKIRFGGWVLRLILAGIAVSALYTSGTGVLKYLADPMKQLPDITFWLLGGLWGITWKDMVHILPTAIPALCVIYLMRWRLNLLSLRDETAFSLTSRPGRERLILLSAAVISTAVVVAKAGQISWVGLIVPHIARKIFGSDARRALPASLMIGGLFVLLCDDVARTVLSGEIPLGILTSFIGAVLFLALFMTMRMKVSE